MDRNYDRRHASTRAFGFLMQAALIFVYSPLTASAAVRYVNAFATGSNNGSSWRNAYKSLQSALAAAQPNDEIWVAAATYKPTTGTDRTISFVMPTGVAIYGGFA